MTTLVHKLTCKYSGLQIGTLEIPATVGAIPYLSKWNDTIAIHPVFALTPNTLFRTAIELWRKYNENPSEKEAEILCVTYLAILHSLDCIQQDAPALPPLHIVKTTFDRLLHLAHWKFVLDSRLLKLPSFHISSFNQNTGFTNIGHYLTACFEAKDDYENKARTLREKHQARAAEQAAKALLGAWVTPVKPKILWAWIQPQLPAKWRSDGEGWLQTLFLGNQSMICSFEEDEIELADQIIQSSCDAGTGIMKAVRDRLQQIKDTWKLKHAAYEIQLEDYAPTAKLFVNGKQVQAQDPGPEPIPANFTNSIAFKIAHAKWTISHRAWNKQ